MYQIETRGPSEAGVMESTANLPDGNMGSIMYRNTPTGVEVLFFFVGLPFRGVGLGLKLFGQAVKFARSVGASRVYGEKSTETKAYDRYGSKPGGEYFDVEVDSFTD